MTLISAREDPVADNTIVKQSRIYSMIAATYNLIKLTKIRNLRSLRNSHHGMPSLSTGIMTARPFSSTVRTVAHSLRIESTTV